MNSNHIKIKWTCERNSADFEDATEDRCGHEFETVEDFYEWEAKSCYVICPHCKANLTQVNDIAIIIESGRKHVIDSDEGGIIEELTDDMPPDDVSENDGVFRGFGYAKTI